MSDSPQEDPWFTATGEEDGKPLIFRCRHGVPTGVSQKEYPHRISIYWPYEPSNEMGMPDSETNDNQVLFEDALDDLTTSDTGSLMLVVTGNARKEWHWYVRDVTEWVNKANEYLVRVPPFPIEIVNKHQPDWSLWRNFVAGVQGLE